MTEVTALAKNYSALNKPSFDDFTEIGQSALLSEQLKKQKGMPVVLVDMSLSMENKMHIVNPIIKQIRDMGIPVFSFGDGGYLARICEFGAENFIDGGGNGAETPLASLATALLYLGKPLLGLESEEAIVKALFGSPDKDGNYLFSQGHGNRKVGGEISPIAGGSVIKENIDKIREELFGDGREKAEKDESFRAVQRMARDGMPLNIVVVTDELAGVKPLSADFVEKLKSYIEAAGGKVDDFIARSERTVVTSKFEWLQKIKDLNKQGINITFVTPEFNLNDGYRELGLQYLFCYYQALAAICGGEAIKLGESFDVEQIFKGVLDLVNRNIKQLTTLLALPERASSSDSSAIIL